MPGQKGSGKFIKFVSDEYELMQVLSQFAAGSEGCGHAAFKFPSSECARYNLFKSNKLLQSLAQLMQGQTIHYFTNFHLFSAQDVQLLCSYKNFIESVIMKLGEDWRIESSLFTQEIEAMEVAAESGRDMSDFSLFNEFLSAYLKDKIASEFQFTRFSDSQIEADFLSKVNLIFGDQRIQNSLTFKTLSLGYCITANQIWNKIFRTQPEGRDRVVGSLKAFGKISQGKSHSGQKGNRQEGSDGSGGKSPVEDKADQAEFKWGQFQKQQFSQGQILLIRQTLAKGVHKLSATQILSRFVCLVSELKLGQGRPVRVFSLSNEFYMTAFIIWLVFSIKMFFSLTLEDYLRYCRYLMSAFWKEEFDRPLKTFQTILEAQWNKLIKDFRMALCDDIEVLKMLIINVRREMQEEWEHKLTSLKETFPPNL